MRFARAIWGCDQQLQTSSGFALAQWLGCQDWTKFYLCRKAVFLVISETKNQLVELILVVQPNPSSPELENSFLSLARGVPAKHHVNGGKSAHNMRNMWNGTHVKGGCPLEKDLLLFATPSIFSWIYRYGPVKTLAPLVHLCPSIGTVNPITWSSFSWKCCPRKLQPKLVTTQLPASASVSLHNL